MKILSTSKCLRAGVVAIVFASTPFLAVADRYDVDERHASTVQQPDPYSAYNVNIPIPVTEDYQLSPDPPKSHDPISERDV